MEDKKQKLRKGQMIALWATGITLFLSVIKLGIGTYFHSEILIADAFHSGADTIAIFASAFGLWIAAKAKSQRFPYGLYKAETFITLIIGVFIVYAGVELIIEGYHKLFFIPDIKKFPILPSGVSVLSIIVAYFIAKKEKQVGMEIHSQSLIVNSKESYLDMVSSAIVLLGIVLSYFKIQYIEGSIIILISLLIIKLGLENLWVSVQILLDTNLNPELQYEIENLISGISGIKEVSEVKIRQAGPFYMVEVKFSTNPSISIYLAHNIADEMEELIQKNFEYIESVFIHIEPSKRKHVRAIIPVQNNDGLNSKVHNHFGRAPYYIVLTIYEENIKVEDFYFNSFLDQKDHIGFKVVKVIIHYDLDLLFTSQIGEISFYMLKNNYIDIYQIHEENITVKEIIKSYQMNRLKRIANPTHLLEDSIKKF